MNEHRKHPRLPLDVQVNLREYAIARSKDISRKGLGLISENPLTVGTIYNLTFHMPDSQEEIKAFGKVRWVNQVSENYHESGIEFWDIDDQDRKKIEAYFS